MRFFSLFAVLLGSKIAFSAPLPAFEGTVTQTQNGATARAKIAWQPPDELQIEVARDDASGTPAQTIVARGDETLVLQSASKRVRHFGFNIAKAWWRGADLSSGGPANFLFAGTAFPAEAGEGRFLRRDDVLFGGSGANAYYAALKTSSRHFAATIATQIAGTSATRTEKNARDQATLSAQLTLDGAGLPRTAEVSEAGRKSSFTYDLHAVTTPLAVTAPLAIAAIPRVLLEDAELGAPSSYPGTDASSLFNRGAALAQNEDFPAAFSAFERAAAAAPTASAPVIADFELSMAIRDAGRAQTALAKIEALNLDPLEILPRRARLALLRRDYAGAKAAYEGAAQSAPQNFALALLRADLAASTGQIDEARALWRGLLASDAARPSSQALAAQNLALYATPDELAALLASIPATNDAQKLARSLLQLRGASTGTATATATTMATGTAIETAQFASDAMEEALALGLEGAARDAEARQIWEVLARRGDEALKNRALSHQMTLAARRGDVSASLDFWRAWNAGLSLATDRDRARIAFLDAWQKAFRAEALTAALENRVTATGASEDDLRLFLALQEQVGSSDDVTSAVETGLARFPHAPFWLGRKAELLLAQANQQPGTEGGIARRAQLYQQAYARLDEAAAASPSEPFYRFQKSIAASQRGAKLGGVIDAGIATQNLAFAARQTAALIADFPGDADVLVSAALQNLTLEGEKPARAALQLAAQALDGAPGDGDRHALVWAARQAMASAYRRLSQPELAATQWGLLLLGARSSGEQGTLAASYFGLLEGQNDAAGAANLLQQLASEAWNYSASRTLLDSVCTRVAVSPLAPKVSAALLASDRDAAALAGASLAGQRILVARRVLENAAAPPAADADLDRATRDLGLFLAKLQDVAAGQNPVLKARASAFLAENASLDGEARLQLLRGALQIEPRDAALRFALIGALSGALNGEAAKTERDLAARVLDFTPETRRSLANAARKGGDVAGAQSIAEEAFAVASRSPEVGANDFQRVAFALAKAAYSAGQTGRGVEIYNALGLPQWNPIDRAAAYLSHSRSAGEVGKNDEVTRLNGLVAALGLSPAEVQGAISFADDVEN